MSIVYGKFFKKNTLRYKIYRGVFTFRSHIMPRNGFSEDINTVIIKYSIKNNYLFLIIVIYKCLCIITFFQTEDSSIRSRDNQDMRRKARLNCGSDTIART